MKSNSIEQQIETEQAEVKRLASLFKHYPSNTSYKRGLSKARLRLRRLIAKNANCAATGSERKDNE